MSIMDPASKLICNKHLAYSMSPGPSIVWKSHILLRQILLNVVLFPGHVANTQASVSGSNIVLSHYENTPMQFFTAVKNDNFQMKK